MDKIFVPIVLGTAREGRMSEKVAKYVLAEAQKFGFDSELVDVRDHLKSATDNTKKDTPWAGIVNRASAFIIVAPEYNHGYPGELKLLLDGLYQEYSGKAVGICGVSVGPVGGARMIMALTPVLVELGMKPIRPLMPFGKVGELFNADGQITDTSYEKKLQMMFEGIRRSL